MIGSDPKFKKGDKVLLPLSKEVGTIISCFPDIFDGYECVVECRLGRRFVHETNLQPATALDEIVQGLDAESE